MDDYDCDDDDAGGDNDDDDCLHYNSEAFHSFHEHCFLVCVSVRLERSGPVTSRAAAE